jgi:hypothetical protein
MTGRPKPGRRTPGDCRRFAVSLTCPSFARPSQRMVRKPFLACGYRIPSRYGHARAAPRRCTPADGRALLARPKCRSVPCVACLLVQLSRARIGSRKCAVAIYVITGFGGSTASNSANAQRSCPSADVPLPSPDFSNLHRIRPHSVGSSTLRTRLTEKCADPLPAESAAVLVNAG